MSSGAIELKRLPPNPRRRKIPIDQRKRVARACDSCNVRRIKCSGSQPCTQCTTTYRTCKLTPDTSKVRPQAQRLKELEERCLLLERCLADVMPSEKGREALLFRWADRPTANLDSADGSSRSDDEHEKAGDGRILQDPNGQTRYLGESSGAAFIDRLREFVAKVLPLLPDKSGLSIASAEEVFTSLLGRYHTHDSRPLVLPEVDPFYLPDAAEVKKLFTVFRFYGQDGPEGGIYYWGDLCDLESQALRYIENSGTGKDAHILANLNVVLALACQYNPSVAPSWEGYPGEKYFARAKFLLLNPMEDARLSNMRTLCLMGHYLLGIYRRDAAYLYIGLAGRIAVIHGLHKGWMIEGQGVAGEHIKRQFWNTYIMDRWLSCLMGRPTIIPEEAVNVAYPANIPGSNLPLAAGLRAHVKLSIIVDEIITKLYGTSSRGRSISKIIPSVSDSIQKLKSWMEDLPPSLRFGCEIDTKAARACLILHMMYNQLMILCTRPFLFIAAKHAVAAKYITSRQYQPYSNISFLKICSEAARRNTQLSRRLLESSQASAFSTLDYHHAFSAALVLQLARFLPDIVTPDDEESFVFLSEYLRQAWDKGNESAGDCDKMVIEFRAVVSRLLLDSPVPKAAATPGIINGHLIGHNSRTALPTARNKSCVEAVLSQPSVVEFDTLSGSLSTSTESPSFEQMFDWFEDTSY